MEHFEGYARIIDPHTVEATSTRFGVGTLQICWGDDWFASPGKAARAIQGYRGQVSIQSTRVFCELSGLPNGLPVTGKAHYSFLPGPGNPCPLVLKPTAFSSRSGVGVDHVRGAWPSGVVGEPPGSPVRVRLGRPNSLHAGATEVNGQRHTAKYICVATGGRAQRLPGSPEEAGRGAWRPKAWGLVMPGRHILERQRKDVASRDVWRSEK